jgi:acetyltransferase
LENAGAVRDAYAAIQSGSPAAFQGVTVQPMVNTRGYELILGSSIDPQFGPVILFGAGGELVEIIRDRALALPPLNTTLARRLMERTQIRRALQGVRGRKPVDPDALEQIIVRFSQLVMEQKWIKEIDINPLLASSERIVALDARIILHQPDVVEHDLPRPAIRSYPAEYAAPWTLKDGTCVLIRPIRPEDEPMMVRFHESLSDRSVYLRYFQMLQLGQRIAHERLTRQCFIDYDREIALVAESDGGIVAVGRLCKLHGVNEAEIAAIVSDLYQNQGLGIRLVRSLVDIARREKLDRVVASMLPENRQMQKVFERLGFRVGYVSEEQLVQAELRLDSGMDLPHVSA